MHSDALLDIVPNAEAKGEPQTYELVADLMIPAMDLTEQGLRRALGRACSKQIPPSLEVTVPDGIKTEHVRLSPEELLRGAGLR